METTPSPSAPSLQLQIQPSPEGPTSRNAVTESDRTASQTPTLPSMPFITDAMNATKSITVGKTEKKRTILNPLSKPSSSTSSEVSCSNSSFAQSFQRKRGIRLFRSRQNRKALSGPGRPNQGDVKALALPLGMSIAAVVSQILKRKDEADKTISAFHLSQICAGAVRESLVNVYGDNFDGFVENFEKSFRSTLMTLHLINKSAKDDGGEKGKSETKKCYSEVATASSPDRSENSAWYSGRECWSDQLPRADSSLAEPSHHEEIEESIPLNCRDSQLVLHDRGIEQELASFFPSRNSTEFNKRSVLSPLEKSVMEQVRSNDLKRLQIGLTMRKLQLKERQLTLRENANLLERWKLSFGFSKASFKVEKFKTQLEDTKHADLLRKCIDCLVAGLLVMLACVGYGVFVYSHRRITEATTSCTPAEESKSWFSSMMPKPMAAFNSGLQILKCHFQVLTRMFAGGLMVLSIACLLLQRSASSNQAMPVTFIVLLLAIACGFAGKLCIDTLGGSGYHWLLYWEILCCLHLFSNLWTSILYRILHGPLNVAERKKMDPYFPYWMRRCLFYGTTCFFLPLLCGFLPFASLGEWKDHFSSLIFVDDSDSINVGLVFDKDL